MPSQIAQSLEGTSGRDVRRHDAVEKLTVTPAGNFVSEIPPVISKVMMRVDGSELPAGKEEAEIVATGRNLMNGMYESTHEYLVPIVLEPGKIYVRSGSKHVHGETDGAKH